MRRILAVQPYYRGTLSVSAYHWLGIIEGGFSATSSTGELECQNKTYKEE